MSNLLDGLEHTIIKRTKGMLFDLILEKCLSHIEYITPEEAEKREALREAKIEEARLKLFASLSTLLTFIPSAVSTLIEIPLLTLIKKQTIKLITHNRFIISK